MNFSNDYACPRGIANTLCYVLVLNNSTFLRYFGLFRVLDDGIIQIF